MNYETLNSLKLKAQQKKINSILKHFWCPHFKLNETKQLLSTSFLTNVGKYIKLA